MGEDAPSQGLEVQLPRPTCAYCKDSVEIQDDKSACEACMSWAHAECVVAHGACPACGVGAPARPLRRAGKEDLGQRPERPPEPREASTPREDQVTPRAAAAETSVLDLLLLVVFGLAAFALSMVAFGVLVSLIGGALGLLTGPGAEGKVAAYAAMGSLVTTPLLVLLAAGKLAQRRAAAEDPASPTSPGE